VCEAPAAARSRCHRCGWSSGHQRVRCCGFAALRACGAGGRLGSGACSTGRLVRPQLRPITPRSSRGDTPWEALPRLKDYLATHLKPGLRTSATAWPGSASCVHRRRHTVEDGRHDQGPRHHGRTAKSATAPTREHVIVGDGCLVGNGLRLKNSSSSTTPTSRTSTTWATRSSATRASRRRRQISNLKITPATSPWTGRPALDNRLRKLGALIGDHRQRVLQCRPQSGAIWAETP